MKAFMARCVALVPPLILWTVLSASAATETVLYSFQGGPNDGAYPGSGLIHVNGTLYGTTAGGGNGCEENGGCGTIYSFNPKNGAERVLYNFRGGADGAAPQYDLINVDDVLYGTTREGGIEGYFSIVKRGIHGVYHHVSPQHLKRYLAEFDYRYNERQGLEVNDATRM